MPLYSSLQTHETTAGIKVQAERFSIEISRGTGLVREVCLGMHRWVTSLAHLPDLWISASIDPRGNEFRACFETSAEMSLSQLDPDQVVIRTQGKFYRISGETLPLRWAIQYDIRSNGILRIAWSLHCDAPTALRWVAIGGLLQAPSDGLLIFEHEASSAGFGLDTEVHKLKGGDSSDSIEENMPWFQVGTDDGSVDVVFPHLGQAAVGWTDTSPYQDGDPLGIPKAGVRLENYAAGVRWQRYRVRNAQHWITPNNPLSDEVYLGLQPVREDPPSLGLLSTYWEGPHQFIRGYQVPSTEDIQGFASEGVGLVIGGVNWASGDYQSPSNLHDAQQFIATCHDHGIKVLPYVTLHDLEYLSPVSPLKDEMWRIEPVVEFNYRSHLMCTGAEEWREYWQKSITAALDVLDIDGLYIDFWAGKLICSNARHGCAGGRYNAETAADMLEFARRSLIKKTGHSLIIANTNVLPLAMINNSLDVRLVGEGKNIETIPQSVLRAFYDPTRFGTSQLILVDSVESISSRTVAMALATTSTLAVRKRERARTPEELRHWESYRRCLDSFVDGANPTLTTYEVGRRAALPESVFVNVYCTDRALVIAMANLGNKECIVERETLKGLMAVVNQERIRDDTLKVYEESTRSSSTFEGKPFPTNPGYVLEAGTWAVVTF